MKVIYNGYEFQISFANPNFRFKGGGSPKLPPVAAPAPTPESIQEGTLLAGSREALLRRRQRGRRSTILTEGGLGIDTAEKKSLLG